MKQSKLASLAIVISLAASAASAQENFVPSEFGAGVSYLMIPGTAFVPSNSATGYAKPFLFLHRTGGGDSEFTHMLTLPTGAAIESVTAYVGDTSAAADVTLRMCVVFATPDTGTGQDLNCDGGIGVPAVATTGTPGPTALLMPVNRTFTNVQNGNDTSHVLLVHLGAADSTTRLHSVKVRWQRQVGAGPAVATFADVPTTHPLFRFVEAMAASGITGGCGTGQFCPNSPLTRGQMSVFLAVALGLHWVP